MKQLKLLTAALFTLVLLIPLNGRSDLLTDLSLSASSLLYNGGVVDDGGTGGSQSGVPALGDTEHLDGFTANIAFTPTAGDLAGGAVLLMELGGTSNGFGLYLVNGVPTLLMKQSSSDGVLPDDFSDTALPAMAVQSSAGTLSADLYYSFAAVWNHSAATLELLVKPAGGAVVYNSFSISGTVGNWSGNDTFSVATFSDHGSVGGFSGNNSTVEAIFDVDNLAAFSGSVESAQLWNAVGSTMAVSVSFSALPTTVNSGNTNEQVVLDWSALDIPAGATYTISASQAGVTYSPAGAQAGSLSAPSDSGTVTATINGSRGDTVFSLVIEDASSEVVGLGAALVMQLEPVLSVDATPNTIDITNANQTVVFSWTGTDLPLNATYAITADNPVSFPEGGNTGSITTEGITSNSLPVVVNGTLGNTTLTMEIFTNGISALSKSMVLARARPNIIFILVDDLGYSDLGCYGSEISTPVIDNLAATGLRFTHCYNAARCSPSRAGLLTGQHPHAVFTNPAASLSPLRTDNNITVAELLGSNGYNTYAVGKWHLGTSTGQKPEERGFEHFWGYKDNDHSKDTWDESLYRFYSSNNEISPIVYGPGEFYQSDAIGDYATNFLDHALSSDKPFFMYIAFGAPHFPIQAPIDKIDEYVPVYTNGWEHIRTNRYENMKAIGLISEPRYHLSPASDSPPWQSAGVTPIPDWAPLSADRKAHSARLMATYAAMIDILDSNVGKVTSKLEQYGKLGNTLIVFLSDNGGDHEGGVFGSIGLGANTPPLTGADLLTMGQPGYPPPYLGAAWANASVTPYTYYKRNCQEGGIASPLVVHWPDGISRPVGGFVDSPVDIIDFMSTVLDITGFEYPSSFNGHSVIGIEPQSISILPQFSSTGTVVARELGFEHESNRGYRKGDWKLVTKNYTDSRNVAGAIELYNLASDPVELNDLAASDTDKVAELVADWNAWATRVKVPSSRLLTYIAPPPQANPPLLPIDLFVDRYNRDNNMDHDAQEGGMTGSLVPPLGAGAAYYDSWEQGSTEIADLVLRMAVGTAGMSETALQHNFVDQEILDAGGFSVQLRINEINSITTDSSNRYVGFGVGLTAAEAQQSNDIFANTAPYSFRGSISTPGTADFFIELDLAGNVKVWSNGSLLETIPVGVAGGTLTAAFELGSFASGGAVTVTAFLDEQLLDLDSGSAGVSRTFVWDNSSANYIGLSARASSYTAMDNLAVRIFPFSESLASEYALSAGLNGSAADLDADPDDDGNDNRVEFAIGSDPAVADADIKGIASGLVATNTWELYLRRHIDYAAIGLGYTTLYCTNLASNVWNEVSYFELSSESVSNNANYETVRIALPEMLINENTNLFIRAAYE